MNEYHITLCESQIIHQVHRDQRTTHTRRVQNGEKAKRNIKTFPQFGLIGFIRCWHLDFVE